MGSLFFVVFISTILFFVVRDLKKIIVNKRELKKDWISVWHGDREVHTVPRNDLIEHQPEDCPCNPETRPVPRKDGSMGWTVTHDAKDGRE